MASGRIVLLVVYLAVVVPLFVFAVANVVGAIMREARRG